MRIHSAQNRAYAGTILIIFVVLLSSCSSPEGISDATPSPSPTNTETPIPTMTIPSQTSTPQPDILGEWSDAPSMLTPRSAHAVAVSDSFILSLAGTDDNGKPVLDVEVFDGTEWRSETTLPGKGLNAATASIVDNRLYVMGGFLVVSNKPTGEVQVYDFSTKTWGTAAPMPNPRGGHAAVVLDGKIHLLGGGNSATTLADHSVYDPLTDSWRDLAPLPRSEGSPAAVVVDGKIYAIGGRSGYSDFGDVYIYDSASDSWAEGPVIEPRGTAGAVYYCGGIYLFGGESQAKAKNLDNVLRLDLEKNIWETVSPMPAARKFARAVVLNDSIYIVGGSVVLANSHSPTGSASVLKYSQPGCN